MRTWPTWRCICTASGRLHSMSHYRGPSSPSRKARLAGSAWQLRNAFDLGTFHDEFLAAGMIPVALTQREMIGPEHIDKKLSLP